MAKPIWDKAGIELDQQIQDFLAGDDVVLDRQLIQYDIQASKAHAEGLARIYLLSADELAAIENCLDQLASEVADGRFVLDAQYEDMHSAIEAYLIAQIGDAGRKIHSGRSRNDQVLVAMRLHSVDTLRQLKQLCANVSQAFYGVAEEHALVPMPGYTHLQRAMPSSVGMWAAGYLEAFIDDALLAESTLEWIDANPLGSASGYGVNIELDRDFTTQALGFSRVQVAATYAQLSRGKFELQVLQALSQALLDVRRLAWDLSLFVSAEYGFLKLPQKYTTGSSLMPNKRNPDLIELLRASYAVIAGARVEIEQLLSLPSGYHRDLQFSKGPYLRAVRQGLSALALLPDLINQLHWNEQAMHAAFDEGMFATDRAMELSKAGVPFRIAYQQAAESPLPSFGADANASLQARVSLGSGSHLGLDRLKKRLQSLQD